MAHAVVRAASTLVSTPGDPTFLRLRQDHLAAPPAGDGPPWTVKWEADVDLPRTVPGLTERSQFLEDGWEKER